MTDTTQDTAAITVPLDLFKRPVALAEHEALNWNTPLTDQQVIEAARREIEQVEALLASPLE